MSTPSLTRRKLLIGATSTSLLAPSIVRADREMLSVAQGMRAGTMCENAGVMTSDIATRISQPQDFVSSGACKLAKRSVEGPYFICADTSSSRHLAEGVEGQPLTVALRVVDKECSPIEGAIVDVWSCNAEGYYSGHDVDPDSGERVRGRREPDLPSRFLRGVLATDKDGIAEFDMIYPGYYIGRPVHTHFKVHLGNQEFLTSQALFPEEMNTKILSTPPYNKPRKAERVLNANDPEFIGNAGVFSVFERENTLVATINLAVDI